LAKTARGESALTRRETWLMLDRPRTCIFDRIAGAHGEEGDYDDYDDYDDNDGY
jgi:hypothetical protein